MNPFDYAIKQREQEIDNSTSDAYKSAMQSQIEALQDAQKMLVQSGDIGRVKDEGDIDLIIRNYFSQDTYAKRQDGQDISADLLKGQNLRFLQDLGIRF